MLPILNPSMLRRLNRPMLPRSNPSMHGMSNASNLTYLAQTTPIYAAQNNLVLLFCVLIAAKNLDVNCGLFLARTFVGTTKFLTLCSQKILATVVAVVLVVSIALFNFEKLSIITKIYWLLLFVFGRRRKMSMAMSSSGFVAGKP